MNGIYKNTRKCIYTMFKNSYSNYTGIYFQSPVIFVFVLPQYELVKSGVQDYCCIKRDLVIFTNYILTNILELSAKCHENLVNFFFEYYSK